MNIEIKIKTKSKNKENDDKNKKSQNKEFELGPDGKRYTVKTEPEVKIEITEE